MLPAHRRPPTLPGFAPWYMVFAGCGGLHWGSAWLLLSATVLPPLLLCLWLLRRL